MPSLDQTPPFFRCVATPPRVATPYGLLQRSSILPSSGVNLLLKASLADVSRVKEGFKASGKEAGNMRQPYA